MNAPTRPARRGRKTRSDDTLPAQLDWREIRNHMAPLAPLSDDQIESIHLASLRLLEELKADEEEDGTQIACPHLRKM